MKNAKRLLGLIVALILVFSLVGCKKKVAVTFDFADGVTPVEKVELKKGQTISELPADPQRDGYEFIGWEIAGESFDSEQKINGNITVVAVWEKLYSVTFNLNYDGKTEVFNLKKGESIVEIDVEQRHGYEFLGWFKDNALFLKPFDFDTEVMDSNDLTIYAKWESFAVIEGIGDITYLIGDGELDLLDGVSAYDLFEGSTPTVTVDEGELDLTEEGTYEVTYKAVNLSGKETLETIEVTVVYENRLLIKQGDDKQELLIQVKEEILGFIIKIGYTGSGLKESDIKIDGLFGDWYSDINVENGVITIAATGLEEIDVYLLTEMITITLGFELELISLEVDTVEENKVVIK